MSTVVLPPDLRRELLEHVTTACPHEGCGILLGRRDAGTTRVEAIVPASNGADRPATRYDIPVEDLFAAHRRAREEGREVVGYFHSHPGGPAVPSAVDREDAWEGMRQVIVGWTGPEPEIRCWRFDPEPAEEELAT